MIKNNTKPHLKHIKPEAPAINALPKIYKENIAIGILIHYKPTPAYIKARHIKLIKSQ